MLKKILKHLNPSFAAKPLSQPETENQATDATDATDAQESEDLQEAPKKPPESDSDAIPIRSPSQEFKPRTNRQRRVAAEAERRLKARIQKANHEMAIQRQVFKPTKSAEAVKRGIRG